jgi:hypothetical protein
MTSSKSHHSFSPLQSSFFCSSLFYVAPFTFLLTNPLCNMSFVVIFYAIFSDIKRLEHTILSANIRPQSPITDQSPSAEKSMIQINITRS